MEDYFSLQPNKPQSPPVTGWQKYRAACKLGLLSVGTMVITHVSRLVPFVAPVVGIVAIVASLGAVGWAVTTKGDQRIELMMIMLASILGFAFGVWDAWELLTVIGAKYYVGGFAIALIVAMGFLSEGRPNAK